MRRTTMLRAGCANPGMILLLCGLIASCGERISGTPSNSSATSPPTTKAIGEHVVSPPASTTQRPPPPAPPPQLPTWAVPSADNTSVQVDIPPAAQYRFVWQIQRDGAPVYLLISDGVNASGQQSDSDDVRDADGRRVCSVQSRDEFTTAPLCFWPADQGTVPVLVWPSEHDTRTAAATLPNVNCRSCIAPQSDFPHQLKTLISSSEQTSIRSATHEIWRVRHNGSPSFLIVNIRGKGYDILISEKSAFVCTLGAPDARHPARMSCPDPIDAGSRSELMWRHPAASGEAIDPALRYARKNAARS